MKKKIILIITISLVTVFIGLIIANLILFNNLATYDSNLTIDKENNILYTNSTEDIKVLQISDIQVDGYHDMLDPFLKIKQIIKLTTPDLIVITGDTLDNIGGKKDIIKIANFMDSFQIPWAPVYGNHDHWARVSIKEQNKIYESSKYCLFKTGDVADSNGNYYYTIKNQNEAIYSLIFMDSKEKGFNAHHTIWYESVINKINQENNKTVPNMVFCHIPIPEIVDAYDAYVKDNSIGTGVTGEEVSPHEHNYGIFDKMVELGSTKIVAFGHDHVNSLHVKYKDIMLCYGLKIGYTSYYDKNIQGGCLYTISSNKEVTIEKIFL